MRRMQSCILLWWLFPVWEQPLLKMLFFVFLRYLCMGFLLNKQPRRKAIFEVAFVFLTLGDCHLLPQFFNQCIVLFAQTLHKEIRSNFSGLNTTNSEMD